MEPFTHLRPLLNTGLLSQLKEGSRTRKKSPFLWLLLAALLIGFAWWGFSSITGYLKWNRYLAHLKSVPGLVVTETSLEDGKWRVEGLKDPAAPHPDSLLAPFEISPETVAGQWESYLSLEQPMILARAHSLLNPPATVTLTVQDGVLQLNGSASASWAEEVKSKLSFVYGISGFDDTELRVTDATLDELANMIRSTSILFSAGSSAITPTEGAKLPELAENVRQSFSLSERHLNIIGHASTEGSDTVNARLSEERATEIMNQLVALGLPEERLHYSSAIPQQRSEASPTERAANRSTRLSYSFLSAPSVPAGHLPLQGRTPLHQSGHLPPLSLRDISPFRGEHLCTNQTICPLCPCGTSPPSGENTFALVRPSAPSAVS